jgi:hypothetical protein
VAAPVPSIPDGTLRVHLTRGPRPPGEVRNAPPWAYAERLGGARFPDIAFPPGGPAEMVPGWWGSADLPKGGGVAAGKMRTMAIAMPLVVAVVFARIAFDPSLSSRPSAALFVGTFTFVTFGLIIGFVVLRVRRRDRKTYSTRAQSRMRLDPGAYDLTAVAAAIDTAVRYRVPASMPRPPPPSCVAEWATSTGSFVLRLWRGAAGSLPMIELESSLPAEETTVVKGAVEAALFG